MIAMKEPNIKPSKYARKTYACPVCGIEVDPMYSDGKKYCPECNGDVCFNNAKHHVENGYCIECNMQVKNQPKYQQWMNYCLPACSTHIDETTV
jgi:hypothetical protein